jgi:threonine dehydrogenase-like Zn-dependent dehydrogenase
MRAVCLSDAGLRFDSDFPKPEPGLGEALVRVHLAGVCSTDLELVKGYFGFQGVLGHEFVGTVEASDDPAWNGKRVVSSINFAERHSLEFAEYGFEHHPQRTVLGILGHDGVMADYTTVPCGNLYEVPTAMADDVAVFTEPLAAALRIAQQLPIHPDSRIAVVGPGRLGMLVARVLSLGGAEVTVLGRSEGSLELATRWSLNTGLADAAPAKSFHCVVETTGSPNGLQHALRLCRPLGTVVMKSTYAELPQVNLTPIVVDELTVVGSRCGPFAPAIRLLQQDVIDTDSLIDGRFAVEQALEAIELAAKPGVRKVLLHFA